MSRTGITNSSLSAGMSCGGVFVLLCAGQREGEIVGFHLKRPEATRVKSSTTVAQPSGKMLKVFSTYFVVTGFSKGRLSFWDFCF